MTKFHSVKARGLQSAKILKHNKYDFSMQNKVSPDSLFTKHKDYLGDENKYTKNERPRLNIYSPMDSSKISYKDQISYGGVRSSKANTGKNQLSRGSESYQADRSLEFNTKHSVLSAERHGKYEKNSYTHLRVSNAEPIRTMKMMKSISSKNSVNNLLKGVRTDTLLPAETHKTSMNHSRDEKLWKGDNRSYMYNRDSSTNNSKGYDSPNKPNETRVYSKLYKFPSSYANTNRYRSISFQSKLDSSGVESPQKSMESNKKSALLPQRKSQQYRNLLPGSNTEDESINYEARVKARQAMRAKEFEKLYQQSSEMVLKTPPMETVGQKAALHLRSEGDEIRKSLAEQIEKHTVNQKGTRFHNMEALNSDRPKRHIRIQKDSSAVLLEKDIPDEGNARRPDLHKTKINHFQGTSRKLKPRLRYHQAVAKPNCNKLNMNNSYEQNQKYELKSAETLRYNQRFLESKENRNIKTKRNLDENIEPERCEKFINIKSSENFCPGRTKKEKQGDSDKKWNFWQTLKNPLQWFGLTKEEVSSESEYASNTPTKITPAVYIENDDSGRNRSISYHVQAPTKGTMGVSNYPTTERQWKYPKSGQKKETTRFAEVFRKPYEPRNNYNVMRSMRQARKINI